MSSRHQSRHQPSPNFASLLQVRDQLRCTYEELLLQHLLFSQGKEVEVCIWKGVFYRTIEEFRKRIKQAVAAGVRSFECSV